jgi:hypothetical protein
MVNLYKSNYKWFKGSKAKIILHLATWLILFVLPAYFLYVESGNDMAILRRSYVQIFLYAIIFYANYLFLVPSLFLRKRKVLYFVSAIVLLAGVTWINEITFRKSERPKPFNNHQFGPEAHIQPPPGMPLMPDLQIHESRKKPLKDLPLYNFILSTVFLSGFGLGLSFIDKFSEQEKRRETAEKEKLNSELAFLRNQINPHFLFNTLNNIYSLVQMDTADGQRAILKLSKLLRYILYETEKGDRQLSQEIEFMQAYIDLFRLRISDKVALNVSFPQNYTDVSIPPLLFLPFIENAFKHGISYRRASFIDIALQADQNSIRFACSNSIGVPDETTETTDNGIGLENVKKRLALLYPGKHTLTISQGDEYFDVALQIEVI